MKPAVRSVVQTLLLGALLGGCTKDEGPLYVPKVPEPTAGFDTVHFNTEVRPIFTQHCWTCHPQMGGLDLSADMAYENLVGVTSVGHAPAVRVVPGDPEASVLWHKVTQTDVYGLPMPPTGYMLSDAELDAIRQWIEQGAMNN